MSLFYLFSCAGRQIAILARCLRDAKKIALEGGFSTRDAQFIGISSGVGECLEITVKPRLEIPIKKRIDEMGQLAPPCANASQDHGFRNAEGPKTKG